MLDLVRATIKRDNELREQHQVGEKFRFISDRLRTLLERLEAHANVVA